MNTQNDSRLAAYFPLAGAQGVTRPSAQAYDRRWRVVDAVGRPIDTAHDALADISVDIKFGYLVLRATGMLRLDIPLEVEEDDPSVLETLLLDGAPVCVADEGAWAAAWVSQVLGRPARLVKVCDPQV